MSKVICEREDLVAVADAIRNKTGDSNAMTLGDMPHIISELRRSSLNTVQVYSVESADWSTYTCLTPEGECVEKNFNTPYTTIGAPSFVLIGSAAYKSMSSNTVPGYKLISGGVLRKNPGDSDGFIYVDGKKPLVFDYVPADNEPT